MNVRETYFKPPPFKTGTKIAWVKLQKSNEIFFIPKMVLQPPYISFFLQAEIIVKDRNAHNRERSPLIINFFLKVILYFIFYCIFFLIIYFKEPFIFLSSHKIISQSIITKHRDGYSVKKERRRHFFIYKRTFHKPINLLKSLLVPFYCYFHTRSKTKETALKMCY